MEWRELVGHVMAALNYKIFEIDGNGISVAKLLTGIFLLVLGYVISKRASREVEKRVLVHMPLEDSMRYTLRQLIFYFLLFITTLFTLRALNVPITIFTVLGGALAVGIGFGSQNLVNNFISGVLVMMERPMRVGDFIEVDGVSGQVESIGIRSTTIRTLQNILVVIPNTNFIEKNLMNYTLSGHLLGKVTVGVAYGTDVGKLQTACSESLKGISDILAQPAPALIFSDFGDSALLFDLVYYIPAAAFPDRRGIESQIRFRMNELFHQAGIQIPFPIRDVQLKVTESVPVKILN
jgi:potassium-dependent mechanosensitive channel